MNPNTLQKKTKTVFWRKVKNNPMIDAASMTPTQVADVTGESMVIQWWSQDGFKIWFLDSKVIEDTVSLGAAEAINRLVEIVNERDVGPKEAVTTANQIAAAKILIEAAGMVAPKKTEMSIKANQLPDDEKALRKYVEANSKKLKILDAK